MRHYQVSGKGRALIEGFEALRLKAYRDSVGIWTIGYGHTAVAGPPNPVAEADRIFSSDLGKFETGVSGVVNGKLTQNEFDALVSLAFNIGLGAFRSSSLLHLLNQGDKRSAADKFLNWTHAGGKVLPGLVRRRTAERKMFLEERL